MKNTDIVALSTFETLVNGEEREIESVYCADLLSWAMGRAPADSAWCTVMGNINVIAVASLTDVAVIVLCEGSSLDEEAKEKAQTQNITIISTKLPVFEAGLEISKKLDKYTG